MALKRIDRSEWQDFFDKVSKSMKDQQAEIEVAAFSVFDQIEAEWLTIIGISYDPKDDIISVYLENEKGDNLDHLIHRPEKVEVYYKDDAITEFSILSNDGSDTIIRLKSPLKL